MSSRGDDGGDDGDDGDDPSVPRCSLHPWINHQTSGVMILTMGKQGQRLSYLAALSPSSFWTPISNGVKGGVLGQGGGGQGRRLAGEDVHGR